jgi:hypothetical protein
MSKKNRSWAKLTTLATILSRAIFKARRVIFGLRAAI